MIASTSFCSIPRTQRLTPSSLFRMQSGCHLIVKRIPSTFPHTSGECAFLVSRRATTSVPVSPTLHCVNRSQTVSLIRIRNVVSCRFTVIREVRCPLRQSGRRATGIFRPALAVRLYLFSCSRSRRSRLDGAFSLARRYAYRQG